MNRLRLFIVRWLLPTMPSWWVEIPYHAAVVLIPEKGWTEEDANHLTAELEAKTGKNVSVMALVTHEPYIVEWLERLP